ncbi:MAG: hypothetical protein QOE90_1394 [Thermoplasmata archaeon]|jgi:hypothetical protein|nr:hypothetical protein [Thermoplasmata archaeon]
MTNPPVHICGRAVEGARHICAFVHSRDEEYAIMAPYVKEATRQNERVVQIINEDLRADHKARMAKAGVDVEKAEASGQLSILRWEDAYLQGGYFDHDRMLNMLQTAIRERKELGYPQMRAMANMDWALRGAPGTEHLLEYEARANFVSRTTNDVFLCFYDLNKFPASTVVDVMRTHPAVIIGGVYHENPYYVEPETLLEELVARGKAKRA